MAGPVILITVLESEVRITSNHWVLPVRWLVGVVSPEGSSWVGKAFPPVPGSVSHQLQHPHFSSIVSHGPLRGKWNAVATVQDRTARVVADNLLGITEKRSSGSTRKRLWTIEVDILDWQVPMCVEDLESALFFALIGFLIGKKLL